MKQNKMALRVHYRGKKRFFQFLLRPCLSLVGGVLFSVYGVGGEQPGFYASQPFTTESGSSPPELQSSTL